MLFHAYYLIFIVYTHNIFTYSIITVVLIEYKLIIAQLLEEAYPIFTTSNLFYVFMYTHNIVKHIFIFSKNIHVGKSRDRYRWRRGWNCQNRSRTIKRINVLIVVHQPTYMPIQSLIGLAMFTYYYKVCNNTISTTVG